ncbi:MAG TPA: hypothetical protein VGM69_20140 [Chloroflexota bacterium]|jgi:hypothetical protein
MDTTIAAAGARVRARPTSARQIAAGWPFGAAAGLPWLVLFAIMRLQPSFGGEPRGALALLPFVLLGATVCGWAAAGAYLARASGGGRDAAAASGTAFVTATLFGLMLALRVEEFAVEQGQADRALLPVVLATTFGLSMALALGAATMATGLALRRGRAWLPALGVGALVFAAYLVVALAFNLIPEWRVGGGHSAMVKVAFAANLIVGTLGGAAALRTLRVR